MNIYVYAKTLQKYKLFLNEQKKRQKKEVKGFFASLSLLIIHFQLSIFNFQFLILNQMHLSDEVKHDVAESHRDDTDNEADLRHVVLLHKVGGVG